MNKSRDINFLRIRKIVSLKAFCFKILLILNTSASGFSVQLTDQTLKIYGNELDQQFEENSPFNNILRNTISITILIKNP